MVKRPPKSGDRVSLDKRPTQTNGLSSKSTQNKADPVTPSWPKFQPLIPKSDLSIEVVVPGQILTIPNFWTSQLSKSYVSFLSKLPLTTTPGKPKKGDAVRVNDRYQVWDPGFGEQLWKQTALEMLVKEYQQSCEGEGEVEKTTIWGGEVVGLNPNIRIYRYGQGQFFDQHYDESNSVTLPTQPPTPARTTWTLLLYLTSPATGCIGGETVFYPEAPATGIGGRGKKKCQQEAPDPVVIDLEVGLALLHKHGNDCLLHEGREVQQGEKWVIRSDLCVRR